MFPPLITSYNYNGDTRHLCCELICALLGCCLWHFLMYTVEMTCILSRCRHQPFLQNQQCQFAEKAAMDLKRVY